MQRFGRLYSLSQRSKQVQQKAFYMNFFSKSDLNVYSTKIEADKFSSFMFYRLMKLTRPYVSLLRKNCYQLKCSERVTNHNVKSRKLTLLIIRIN